MGDREVRTSKTRSSLLALQKDLLSKSANTGQRAPGRARIDRIITAAIELLKEHRPADISIAMIAEKAKIKRTSIYSHFSSTEEIFEQISVRFIKQTGVYVEDYVRRHRPRTIEQVVVLMIHGIGEYFNRPDHDTPDALARHVPFEIRHLIEDFDKVAALPYHSLWDTGWDFEPLSDEDPFRTLVVLQSALFELSISRHGIITDSCIEEVVQVAVDFIRRAEARFGKAGARDEASAIDRIDNAANQLLTRGHIAMLEASAVQIEALVKAADALGDAAHLPEIEEARGDAPRRKERRRSPSSGR